MKLELQILATALVALVHSTDQTTGAIITNAAQTTTPTTILKTAVSGETSTDIWTVEVFSFYDLDLGESWFRVTHTLTKNIASTDVVLFDFSFTSSYDPWVDPLNVMIEDSGRCSVA